MSERWLPIAGFEDSYQISDRGRVRSLDRHRLNGKGGQILWRGRVIKPYLQRRTGHVLYNLWRNCAQTKVQAHRLVLETFVGPGPLGHECCHRDGNPQNNWVENLYWGTRSENVHDAVRHGTHNNGRKTHCKWGHPFAGDNLKISRDGTRSCRTCATAARRKYIAKMEAKI